MLSPPAPSRLAVFRKHWRSNFLLSTGLPPAVTSTAAFAPLFAWKRRTTSLPKIFARSSAVSPRARPPAGSLARSHFPSRKPGRESRRKHRYSMTDLVFFYGTLMTPFNRTEQLHIDQFLSYRGRGTISAALFDLGIYPAAV